jgi:phosphate transport system substrate-binding protein
MKNRTPLLSALTAVALAACVAIPAAASAKPTITMSGSTSVAPLASLLAKKYLSECGHCVNFRLLQGGSDIGVADAAAGRVTIGNSSRDPKPSDPGGLVFTKIARDAVCIVTNSANPIPTIDQAGVRAIFGGASQKTSNGLIQQLVKTDPAGIGYVSLYFTSGVHAVPYAGVPCTLRNAKSGQYGGSRNFYMVTRGAPKGAAKAWIKWITHSGSAASIVGTDWVPLH